MYPIFSTMNGHWVLKQILTYVFAHSSVDGIDFRQQSKNTRKGIDTLYVDPR